MTWVLVCRRPGAQRGAQRGDTYYARDLRSHGEDWPYTLMLDFAQEFSTEQAALAHRIEHPSDDHELVVAGPWIVVPLADELLEREARR